MNLIFLKIGVFGGIRDIWFEFSDINEKYENNLTKTLFFFVYHLLACGDYSHVNSTYVPI